MTELSQYTSLRVGGPATKIVQVSTEAQIIAAIEEAGDTPILIMGGGTNVLIADKGFEGTVIRISNNSVQAEVDACSGATLTIGAGEDWDTFVQTTIDRGSIFLNGVDVTAMQASERVRLGLGMVFQLTSVFNELSVSENLRLGALSKYKEARPSSDDEIAEMLKTIGLELRQYDIAANLSHGEQQWLEIGMVLLAKPQILLLDEPTNDLDVNTLRALEEGLENFAGCAVVISHDRWFLDRICTHILAFEGDSQVYWFEGNFSDYEENKKKRLGDVTPKRIRYKNLK